MPFSSLEKFLTKEVSVNLFYIDRCNQNKTKTIKRSCKLVPNKVAKAEIENILKKMIDKYRYKTVREYTIDIETTEIDCIYTIGSAEVPYLETFLREIGKDEIPDLDMNSASQVHTNMTIASFTLNDGNRAICFTSYNPQNLFNGKKIFGVNDTKELVKYNEGLISIADYFDCIYIQNLAQFIIFRKPHFETMFKYTEEYKKKSAEALNEISEKKIIQGMSLSSFTHISKNIPTKKLANICMGKKIDKVIANFGNLIHANEMLPEEGRVKIDKKKKQIIIDEDASDEYVDVVLSLLNLEPHQNIITQDLRFIADQRGNNLNIFQKIGNMIKGQKE